MWKSVGMLILNIWKTKKCSKPPTSSWPQASSDHQFIASSLDHKKAAWSKGWSEIPPSHHGFQYFSLLKWSNDLDDLGYPYDLGKQRKPYLKHENIFFENVWDIKKTDQSSKAHQVKKRLKLRTKTRSVAMKFRMTRSFKGSSRYCRAISDSSGEKALRCVERGSQPEFLKKWG